MVIEPIRCSFNGYQARTFLRSGGQRSVGYVNSRAILLEGGSCHVWRVPCRDWYAFDPNKPVGLDIPEIYFADVKSRREQHHRLLTGGGEAGCKPDVAFVAGWIKDCRNLADIERIKREGFYLEIAGFVLGIQLLADRARYWQTWGLGEEPCFGCDVTDDIMSDARLLPSLFEEYRRTGKRPTPWDI